MIPILLFISKFMILLVPVVRLVFCVHISETEVELTNTGYAYGKFVNLTHN